MRRTMATALMIMLASGCGGSNDEGASARIWVVAHRDVDPASLASVLLRSDDHGARWHPAFAGDHEFRAIAFANPAVGAIVGDGVIVQTTTGGADWSIVREVAGEHLNAVAFSGAADGLAVGELLTDGMISGARLVLETADAGAHWGLATLAEETAGDFVVLKAVCFTGDTTAVVVGVSGFNGPLALRRDAAGWTDISDRFPAGLTVAACIGDSEVWVAGVVVGGLAPFSIGVPALFRSHDAGRTWSDETASFADAAGDLFSLGDLVFADPLRAWIVGARNIHLTPNTAFSGPFVAHTTDGGHTWVPASFDAEVPTFGRVNAVALAPDGSTVFAGGADDDLVSELGGDSALGLTTKDGLAWRRTELPHGIGTVLDVTIVDRP
jgi:hypothetical protein